MKKRNKYMMRASALFILLILTILINACKRQDSWLDIKRQKNDVVPASLHDLQAVLDNTNVMNKFYPQFGLLGADNNYVTNENLNAATSIERNAYLWNKDIYEGGMVPEWLYPYQMVEYANVVLDALAKIDIVPADKINFNNIKGSALFYRAMAFYQLTQLFCKPYSYKTAVTDMGICVRLSSDINKKSTRASVQQSYDQMISDLEMASDLLPETPLYTTRPSNIAATALLAKIYLTMEDYSNAGKYADRVLQKFNTLLDYNSSLVSSDLTYRFPSFREFNPEIIFYAEGLQWRTIGAYSSGTGYINPDLYASYSIKDLRKSILYQDYGNGRVKFQGSYTGNMNNFTGIATNEILLIRAECNARAGNTTEAITDLNTLLFKRYVDGSFTELTATDPNDALKLVLKERRKELPYTGQLRWEDLRRLNNDNRFAVTIQHVYNGITYTLLPNDNRYIFLIPDLEIQTYGLMQNPR